MKKCMNKPRNLLLIIVITCFTLLATSCASKRISANKNLHEISANRLIKEVENNSFVFDEFQTKFTAKVETEDAKLSLKGQLRMKNDSIVWLSISLPVGLEVVRAVITKDSVFVINRTEKTYVMENIKNFKQIPSSMAELAFIQAIFVGNDITLGNGDKYQSEIHHEMYKLKTINKISKTLMVYPANFRIKNCLLEDNSENGRKIELNYEKFEIYNEKIFPTEINLSISKNPKFNISISYSNTLVNTEQDYKFSIPKKFKPAKK